MPDFTPLRTAAVVSATTAAVLLLLLAWPWRKPRAWRLRLAWVLALGAGIYSGCGVLDKWPRWPAPEDTDRLLLMLLPLTLAVEGVAAVLAEPWWAAWLLRLGVAAWAAPILLYHSSYVADLSGPNSAEWSSAQAAGIFLGLGAALAAVWGSLAMLQTRTTERALALVLLLATLAAAVLVMTTGYFYGGRLGLPFAAALAGATLASFAFRSPPNATGYLGVGIIGLYALLVIGHFFASLPVKAAVCLGLAPLLAWIPEIPGLRRLPVGVRAALGVVLVAGSLVFIVLNAYEAPVKPATSVEDL